MFVKNVTFTLTKKQTTHDIFTPRNIMLYMLTKMLTKKTHINVCVVKHINNNLVYLDI